MKHYGLTGKTANNNNNNNNNNKESYNDILLPLPPIDMEAREEMAIYARFMRHLRHVPNSRKEIRILSAIQFTADMLDYSDAHIAKTLVDMGLRAPRLAFPHEFLNFADAALQRQGWEIGAPNKQMLELKSYWDAIGEDKFAAFKGTHSLLGDSMAANNN